ncbi:LIM domain and actin-binding protein 1 [Taenia solium]|eukprot:TsM_000677300 transcript=TsM_000677300 gene=TsM_000677300
MNENSETSHLSSRPDLLNIDREFADNLKILLDNSPSKGLVRLGVASIYDNGKNDSGGSINGISSSSTDLLQKSLPLSVVEVTTPGDVPVSQSNHGTKSIAERVVSSDRKVDVISGAIYGQDSVRTFHTTFFLGNNGKSSNAADLGKAVKVSAPVARSKSFGRKNMSARIQSLLENFESSDCSFDSPPSLPETPRNIEKRPAKQFSAEASMSENKSSAEACFACNRVIYPLDRYSTGSHVYHKSCLRCSICDRSLSSITCESSKDKLFCRPHFLEKAHGILRRMSTPASFSRDAQNVAPHSIAVESASVRLEAVNVRAS